MSVVLAVDLGTTSTAAVALNEGGRLVDVARQAHAADVAGLPRGYAEQDLQRHWQCTIDVLAQLAQRLTSEPVALGLTGQMHSVLTLDAENRPSGNLVTWQDRRANESADGSATFLDSLLAQCSESAIDDTGCRLAPGYAAVTLFVQQKRGEISTGTARAALLADWVAARLTGSHCIVTERSNAASTGVYDLRNDRWSSELIVAASLQEEWFPQVVDAGTKLGGLSQAVAAATGLPAGLPVIVPIGDNQGSVLGSVPQAEPAIQITIGTGGQINWPVETFVRAEGMDTRPLPPDRLMLVGAGLAGGDAFAWVNRTVRSWLSALGVERDQSDVYAKLLELAGDVQPGADGLTCEPFFRGTRREPLRRGLFAGVGNDNMTPGHIARAVLEGIARSLHECWERADERPPDVRRIIGCGNGLEQNPLLVEILSRQFGLPIFAPRNSEAAACGAALLAGTSVGLWSDPAAAGRTIELRQLAGELR
jgi:sugar (pentulose or hexulose) kinase